MNNGFQQTLIAPLLGLLAAGVAINLLIYWVYICRVLYKNGASFPTGLLFWRIPKELKAYRDICSTRGLSFAPYSGFLILFSFNLLLALVLVLRFLWENTQPPS